MAGESGSKLDVYEMEVASERGDALQDLAEFNLAVVSRQLTVALVIVKFCGSGDTAGQKGAGGGAAGRAVFLRCRGRCTYRCCSTTAATCACQPRSTPAHALALSRCAVVPPQTLYNAMLENNCSEHASRMSAMENSSKSAGEILERLTLQYNRDRQATITNELIEIISGAAALEDAN